MDDIDNIIDSFNSIIEEYELKKAAGLLSDDEREEIIKEVFRELRIEPDPNYYLSCETEEEYRAREEAKECILKRDKDLFDYLYYVSKDEYPNLFFLAISYLDVERISAIFENNVYEPQKLVNGLNYRIAYLLNSMKDERDCFQRIITIISETYNLYIKSLQEIYSDVFEIINNNIWHEEINLLKSDIKYVELLKYAKNIYSNDNSILGVVGYSGVLEVSFEDINFSLELNSNGELVADNIEFIKYFTFYNYFNTILSFNKEIKYTEKLKRLREEKNHKYLPRKETNEDFFRFCEFYINYNDYLTDIQKCISKLAEEVNVNKEINIITSLYFLLKHHYKNKDIVEDIILTEYGRIKSKEIKLQILKISENLGFSISKIERLAQITLYSTKYKKADPSQTKVNRSNFIDVRDSLIQQGLAFLIKSNCTIDSDKLEYIFENRYYKAQDYLINNCEIENKQFQNYLRLGLARNSIDENVRNTIIARLLGEGDIDLWIETIKIIEDLLQEPSFIQLVKDYSFKNFNLIIQLISGLLQFDNNIQKIVISIIYLNKDIIEFKYVINSIMRECENKKKFIEEDLESLFVKMQEKVIEISGKNHDEVGDLYKEYISSRYCNPNLVFNYETSLQKMLMQLKEYVENIDKMKISNKEEGEKQCQNYYFKISEFYSEISSLFNNICKYDMESTRQRLENMFGEFWEKINEKSQVSLITAEHLNSLKIRGSGSNIFDYSTICIGYCKAWESEIYEKIINKFIKTFEGKKLLDDCWSGSFINNNRYLKKQFDLYDAELILKYRENKDIDQFIKESFNIISTQYKVRLLEDMRKIRIFRNETAHQGIIIDKNGLEFCRNKLISGDNMFKRIISLIK